MKNYKYFLITISVIALAAIFSGYGGDDLKTSSGAPPGNTNSPADGQNCTHCMGGSAVAVNGWITSDIPTDGYTPGTTYSITVTAPGTGKKGFEVSPQDLPGNLLGTLIAGTGSKLVGVNKYITHSAAVTTNPAVWNFQWKAPDPGVGDVTFYGSIAVTKTQTKTTTMTVSQSTVSLKYNDVTNLLVFPNPCRNHFTLSYSLVKASFVEIILYSVNGQFVQTLLNESRIQGKQSESFAIDQPAGYYLVQVKTEDGNKTVRLIVN